MQFDKRSIIQRIDELAKCGDDNISNAEIVSGTINVLELLYGRDSQKLKHSSNSTLHVSNKRKV